MAVYKLVQSCFHLELERIEGPCLWKPNGDPECVEMNGEPVPVEGNSDTAEMNEDAVGSTGGEHGPKPVCTGVSRGG